MSVEGGGATTRTHSAVHVLKGAVDRVLGPGATASVRATEGRGALAVRVDRRPSDSEVREIEAWANAKVDEDAEVAQFEMERREAERHFGRSIYDGLHTPEGAAVLKMVRIPEWEVSCCAQEHVESTGEVRGRIVIDGSRFTEGEGLLEIEFHLSV